MIPSLYSPNVFACWILMMYRDDSDSSDGGEHIGASQLDPCEINRDNRPTERTVVSATK